MMNVTEFHVKCKYYREKGIHSCTYYEPCLLPTVIMRNGFNKCDDIVVDWIVFITHRERFILL